MKIERDILRAIHYHGPMALPMLAVTIGRTHERTLAALSSLKHQGLLECHDRMWQRPTAVQEGLFGPVPGHACP